MKKLFKNSGSKKDESDPFLKVLVNAREDFVNRWQNPPVYEASFHDFDRIKTLGTGKFGRVMLVQHKESGQYLAIKIVDKTKAVRLKQVQHVINEKSILAAVSFPFLIKLEYAFKDNSYLYV